MDAQQLSDAHLAAELVRRRWVLNVVPGEIAMLAPEAQDACLAVKVQAFAAVQAEAVALFTARGWTDLAAAAAALDPAAMPWLESTAIMTRAAERQRGRPELAKK
jgi:energy-converting hydrogenase Eha subunit C